MDRTSSCSAGAKHAEDRTRANKRCAFCLLLASWLVLVLCQSTGCTWFKSDTDLSARLESETSVDSPPADVGDGKKVRWDGGGVIIGETDTLAFTPESFLTAVNRLSEQNRMASVQGMVESYPDIAIQTLQEAELTAGNRKSMRLIASLLDNRWCNDAVWQPWVEDLGSLPQRSPEHLDIRLRFWRFLKNNQPEEALKLKITRTAKREQGVMLRAEFHRLESIAAMMAEDHGRSIENLETAIALVKEPCPWYAGKLQLLLGEFYRHAGRWDDWKATWQAAVVSSSQLANNHDSIDPQFWNRAAFLRPAGMSWPPQVVENLKSVLSKMDVAETGHSLRLSSDEAVIWFAIGYRHLNRGEGQNALLAF